MGGQYLHFCFHVVLENFTVWTPQQSHLKQHCSWKCLHIAVNVTLCTCLKKTSLECLQVVQSTAVRTLTKPSKYSHITALIILSHWLPINFRAHFKVLILTFRALHGQAPAYISEVPSVTAIQPRFVQKPHQAEKRCGHTNFSLDVWVTFYYYIYYI